MVDLQTKSFDTLVSDQATAVQGSASGLVDFSVGSIPRAVAEAIAAVALWLQGMILQLLATTRAATAKGADLDSWFADYGFARLGATGATGQATFARFTPTAQAVVPIGATVQTGDGSQQYAVVVDANNPAYNAGLGGYVIGAGVQSVTVAIAAATPGSGANAAIGGINTLAQAISGVDTVTNAAALTNGTDGETDAAARIRFVEYLASLSKATKAAVAFALASVETGLTFTLTEDQDYNGAAHLGFFYIVVDDGSGAPSLSLLSRIYATIDLVRPIGVSFALFPPAVVTASVTLQIGVNPVYTASAVATAVQAAITNYINALPLGAALAWSRLIQVAYDASPGVTSVVNLQVNGSTADIAANAKQVVKAGTVAAATLT
jgi:uncharacterized phage protein gp47/JayE